MQDRNLQLWIGTTASRKRLDRLFAESYDEDKDEEPISEFAASQGVHSYDHDFLECRRITKPTNDARVLLEGLSYFPSYIDPASTAAAAFLPANTAVALFAELLEAPRSASGAGYTLHYVGAFAYNTACSGSLSPPATPPPSISLCVKEGGPLIEHGQSLQRIMVQGEGLIIGRGTGSHDRPFLDLSNTPGTEGIAATQVSIFTDQFGQWIIEDHGNNGLTRIGVTVLNGEKTLPWNGSRLSVGALVFEWLCT